MIDSDSKAISFSLRQRPASWERWPIESRKHGTCSLEFSFRPSYFWNFSTLYSKRYDFAANSVGYDGLQSKEDVEAFSCRIRASMSKRVREVTSSSIPLAGCVAAERLSTLTGMTPCTGSSDTGLIVGATGALPGFALTSTSSSRISRCACYSAAKVGANCLIARKHHSEPGKVKLLVGR